MSPPSVSIIIPCYRQGHWLPTAIESALAQTYSSVEVVVVNDGSDDNTDEVARGYGDRIQYVSQMNRGLAGARNAGIKAARGDWFLFLDSDDALHPEAVEHLMAAGEGRVDRLVLMGWQCFSDSPTTPTAPPQLPPASGLAQAMLADNPGPPHSYLTSRQIVMGLNGFEETMHGCADWDFWLRHLFAGADLAATPHVGALYRVSATSMSQNHLLMDEDRARLFDRALTSIDRDVRQLSRHGITASLRHEYRQRAAREHAHVAHLYRLRGLKSKAAHHWWKAVRYGEWRRGMLGLGKLLLAPKDSAS